MSTAQFSFPLNVFARMLSVREGRVDYLHFAVFEDGQRDVLRAQERASELLWQALPPPCRLLEVGIGLGTTLGQLLRAGYAARGITPEQAQIDVARQRQGEGLPLTLSRLEDFQRDAGQWDALLFQESAQYIEPMALFESAERLLHAGPATLVVMDEFALRRDAEDHGGLHLLPAFIALAQRFGWRLSQHTDLSRQVQPTLDYLIDATLAMRADLMRELRLDEATMVGLVAALERARALYRAGVYGYAVLRFERAQPASDRLLSLGPDQAESVRGLFESVFGHPLSAAEWQWKYGDGHGRALGLQREGRLLAHYGALTRRVRFHGREVAACQVCDVMVAAQARSNLARSGPLHRVTASFLEAQIGWGRPHLIGYGFPTQRAMAAAQHLRLYAPVDSMEAFSWTPLRGTAGATVQALADEDLAPGKPAAALVDQAWAAMVAALPEQTLGVRDAAWLRHRYCRHPRFRYQVLLVRRRWTRRLLGVVVLRQHEHHLEWVDLVGAPAQLEVLLAVARKRAHQLGLAVLEAWITHSQAGRFESLADGTCKRRALDIAVPANVHSPGPSVEDQRGRWWLMAGDTDFR